MGECGNGRSTSGRGGGEGGGRCQVKAVSLDSVVEKKGAGYVYQAGCGRSRTGGFAGSEADHHRKQAETRGLPLS